jgi:hypothetical protein
MVLPCLLLLAAAAGPSRGVPRKVHTRKKDVTKGHASNCVATDPSHGGTQPARKGADRTNSTHAKVAAGGQCQR